MHKISLLVELYILLWIIGTPKYHWLKQDIDLFIFLWYKGIDTEAKDDGFSVIWDTGYSIRPSHQGWWTGYMTLILMDET